MELLPKDLISCSLKEINRSQKHPSIVVVQQIKSSNEVFLKILIDELCVSSIAIAHQTTATNEESLLIYPEILEDFHHIRQILNGYNIKFETYYTRHGNDLINNDVFVRYAILKKIPPGVEDSIILQELKWLGLSVTEVVRLTKRNTTNLSFYLVGFKQPYLFSQILLTKVLCFNPIQWDRYTVKKKGILCWNCNLRGHFANNCSLPLTEIVKTKVEKWNVFQLEQKISELEIGSKLMKKTYLKTYRRLKSKNKKKKSI